MTVDIESDIVGRLIAENEEFKNLHEEHLDLKAKVGEFAKKKFLTPDDELELARIKKIKLAGKDRMSHIIMEYRAQQS